MSNKLTAIATAAALVLTPISALANTACDYPVPADKQQEPANFGAKYTVTYVSQRAISKACRTYQPTDRFIAGCAHQLGPMHYQIFILSGQSAADQACTLLYEKAHLPPNYWEDDAMEASMKHF